MKGSFMYEQTLLPKSGVSTQYIKDQNVILRYFCHESEYSICVFWENSNTKMYIYIYIYMDTHCIL